MNEHIVSMERGYDCITFECVNGHADCRPGAGGSHGRHGLTLRFVSKGAEGAVQFMLYTGWLPQRVGRSPIGSRDLAFNGHEPMPADLGYHSKTPHYDGQSVMSEACEYCDGGPCYYDGSSLNASDAMYTLVNGGGDALWAFLDAYYEAVFHGVDYPEAAEYPKPTRRPEATA
jgi:hypothetical protein